MGKSKMGRPKVNVNPEIGERLKLIRKHLKMTQLDFASYYNVSEQAIRNWESGKNTVPPYVLEDLSERLSLDMTFLKCKTDEPRLNEILRKWDESSNTVDLSKDLAIYETFTNYLNLISSDVSQCTPEDIDEIEKETREFISFQVSKILRSKK